VLRDPAGGDARAIALGDVWTAPYAAFGRLRLRTVQAAGGRVEVAIGPGPLAVGEEDVVGWVTDATRAITGYFGAFPIAETLVVVMPARGRWVGEGKTLCGGGGAIFIRLGEQAPVQALRDDWVLVHEMVHLAFPSVPRQHDWAEEGLATYVEPFARVRAGTMTAEAAWAGLWAGLPKGLPGPDDAGLDRTPTWGRTYWGGALFYLLADIGIRRATDNRLGLEHALRGILAAGGNNAQRWPLERAFAAGDDATGGRVLRDLHREMGNLPHPVDLGRLARELGIRRNGRHVTFDDAAPLAAIRRAIGRER
jgi:hypothetical protein